MRSQRTCGYGTLTVAVHSQLRYTLMVMLYTHSYGTLTVMVHSWLWFITVKGYRIKSAQGKSTGGRVHESSKCGASSCPLPVESWETPLSWHQCMITCMEYCQPQQPIESWCLEFLFGFRHLGRVDWPHGWPQSPAPPEAEVIPHDPKPEVWVTSSHYTAWP